MQTAQPPMRYNSRQTPRSSGADPMRFRMRAADPAGQARGGKRARRYPRGDQRRDVLTEHLLPVARAAQGFCRPEAPCMITSACGTGTARWIASIMRSTSKAAERLTRSQPHGLHHRQSECGAEKGGLADSHGRCRQSLAWARSGMFGTSQGCCCRHSPQADVQDQQRRSRAAGDHVPVCFPLGKLRRSAIQGPVFHRALAGILRSQSQQNRFGRHARTAHRNHWVLIPVAGQGNRGNHNKTAGATINLAHATIKPSPG